MNKANVQFLSNTAPRSTLRGIPASLSSGTSVAAQPNTGPGLVATLATSTTAGVLNLNTLFKPTLNVSLAFTQWPGIVGGVQQGEDSFGNMISIYADAADIGIVFDSVLANVTGTHAPLLSAVGTVNASGIYTPNANSQECFRIATGTFQRLLLQSGQDIFMGFVGSATGIMRVYQSSLASP